MTNGIVTSPAHPGEVLAKEYLTPLGMSPHRLAVTIGVLPRRINEIVQGRRDMTVDTAQRLSRHLGTSEWFWLDLQEHYDAAHPKRRRPVPTR